jgi:uncharacterized protein Usg
MSGILGLQDPLANFFGGRTPMSMGVLKPGEDTPKMRFESRQKEVSMSTRELLPQMKGYGLTTAEIHYRMPDHQLVLQTFIWQEFDLAPRFPLLVRFLKNWETLDGPIHSVTVAHHSLIRPLEWRAADGIFGIH